MTGETFAGPFGDTLGWIAGEEETGGAYSMLSRIAPPGAMSVPHEHRRSEAFYVIEGSLTFTIAGDAKRASAGDYLIAPEMVSHGWRVEGNEPARLLLIFAPAASKSYFEEIDALVRAAGGGPIETAAMIDCMRRHGWRE